MSTYPRILLRAETKPLEHRSFAPSTIEALVKAGYPIEVERSSTTPELRRIFEDSEYEAVGATLVPEGSWRTAEPGSRIILGLKEIPEEDFALKNDHIAFSHCYKNQGGWEQVLSRFPRGGSVLYDLEFLVDEQGRRVSAFGYHAGFAGAALAVKMWAWQLQHPGEQLPSVEKFTEGRGYYLNEADLVKQIAEDVATGEKILGRKPTAFIMGALGRCGRGAVDLFVKAGLAESSLVKWDMNETKDRQGPYQEIVDQDIFVNAVGRDCIPETGGGIANVSPDLPLPAHSSFHQQRPPLGSWPQAERCLRRLLRHHQPSQPHPRLLHQHHFRQAYCAG